jgi:hypothetical protein
LNFIVEFSIQEITARVEQILPDVLAAWAAENIV